MIIKTTAHARAGLAGNPSDGYFGKTISFIIRNFRARVTLYETPELEILPNRRDQLRYRSLAALAADVKRHGYYGGLRLLKATLRRFYAYCVQNNIELPKRNVTLYYETNIPSRVGLAGSSAIVTACLRALMAFYEVEIPKTILPTLILGVETDELRIPAGLQDRVIQVYEGLVYMDFGREIMERQGYGYYEPLDPALLPPLYVAYRTDAAEGTEVFHSDIRERFERGEPAVVDAMKYWAALTDEVKGCLLSKQLHKIGKLLDRNFDKRREIYQISKANIRMVEAAREAGASANFTGSGGAIVGTYEDESMYQRLRERLSEAGVRVFKPEIVTAK